MQASPTLGGEGVITSYMHIYIQWIRGIFRKLCACVHMHVHVHVVAIGIWKLRCDWLQWSGCGQVILSHEASKVSSLGEQRKGKECKDRWSERGYVG